MRTLATIIITLAFGLAPLACDKQDDKKDDKAAAKEDKKDDKAAAKEDEKKDGGGGW